MKILINTASTFKGGSIQVASSFLEECKKYPQHTYVVILGRSIAKLIQAETFPVNFSFYTIPFRPATKVFSFNQSSYFEKIEQEVQPDVVFTTSGPAYWRPNSPHLMGFNLPHYVYNESPFFQQLSLNKRIFWYFKGKTIQWFTKRDADYYVVQTDDVNIRLRKWINTQNVITVSNTYGAQYENVEKKHSHQLSAKEKNEFRFLLLSGYYKHKNIEILNDVCEKLLAKGVNNIRFVLTLPQEEFNKIIKIKYHNLIYNVGPQKPVDCPKLYQECDAIFLPTLLECFSATYAEAMKMKVPIITTDMGFARTVCGEAALYYKPTDAGDAVNKILALNSDKNLQSDLIRGGKEELKKFHTPEARAKKYLEICEDILQK